MMRNTIMMRRKKKIHLQEEKDQIKKGSLPENLSENQIEDWTMVTERMKKIMKEFHFWYL
jgi:hypothetical protein